MDFQTGKFAFHQGAVMSQIVLADEINRTSPKTQSSLLEAMQEGQVTVDGQTYPLPRPFMVLATQNPVDFAGTYPLPEAQLDRFLLRVRMGYPSMTEEVEIMTRAEGGSALARIQSVATPEDVLALQEEAAAVRTSLAMREYIAMLVARTRENDDIQLGASPRAAIALNAASKAFALLAGRDFVLPDDVQRLMVPVLAHRILLRPEARLRDMTPERALRNIATAVRVPDAE
jgi:MoxR-like ATPase